MGARFLITGYHFKVEPRRLGDLGALRTSDDFMEPNKERRLMEYKERCEGIASAVKRHADYVGSVDVVAEGDHVCEHCGSNWTEVSKAYNGGCCDKDEENFSGDKEA